MNKSEHSYKSLSEATADLAKRGFTEDFIIHKRELECRENGRKLTAKDLKIHEVYRFEGMTNPADNSIIYALSSKKDDCKGVIINAYGAYANTDIDELLDGVDFREK